MLNRPIRSKADRGPYLYCLLEVSIVLVIEGDKAKIASVVGDLLVAVVPPVRH
jgi:hypothetical protein